MRFNKLRLLGFKSFVEPTEFHIENGLTGVVGPNGCGKSNLVEALRWVMGENSYKNMRASGMDDVIFSGSGNRPARNTAEVSLFLDNSDRTAPAAFNDTDELQVSRRIERESGSVYRINGKDVRAKDVQLLFADASTGARSPSMVGQGRIGELISAKPQARRALLEEAAGISGLHSRRHEAELRLRAAETNLERLDDVVGQLESQLESLKRQARQANRYRNLSGEIRKTEALLFHLRWAGAKQSEAEAESALSALNLALGEKAETQAATAREEAIAAQKLPGLREEEAKSAAILQRLQIAKAQLEEEVSRLEFRRAELENRHTQLVSDLEREEQILADNNLTLENLEKEQVELENASRNVAEVEAKSKEELEQATNTLGTSEASFSELTVKLADENARRNQLKRTLDEATARKTRIEEQTSKIASELAGIVAEIEGLEGPAAKRQDVERLEVELQNAETAFTTAEQATAQARAAEQALRPPLEEAEGKLREVETEARTLRQILNRGGQELFPAVLERITIEPGFETALGAALGEDLDASIEETAAVHWGEAGDGSEDPTLPQGVTPLSSIMRAPMELSRRLAQIGVVDKEDGPRVSKLLKTGQRIVTREGDLWRWDGFAASAEAPTAAAQRLAQKNRLAELEELATTARYAVNAAQESYDGGKDKTAACIETELTARETVKSTQRALSDAREALSAAERSVSQLAAKRSAQEEALNRLGEDAAETEKRIIETDSSLLAMVDTSEAEKQLEDLRTQVAQDRARLAEARAASQGLSREAEARGRRLEVIKTERQNWQNRLKNAHGQIETLTKRRDETAIELKKLETAPDEFSAKRRDLMNQLEVAEAGRKEAADALASAERAQIDADKAARKALEELAQAREQVGRSEERLNAAKERRTEIEARIRDELECHPADVMAMAELKPDDPLPEITKIESRLERQKAERERLGAVNLRADTEQSEIEEKRDEIVSEREDLIEAIAKLRSGINSLNKEGRERLLEAFDVVNKEFQRLFTSLFGGGTAELQLIESDDPLEAGLEILARPPGKKPQTMTLLSGGEQALTATALIFAVFLTNPAPICVLDEIDAPLDDHNVERFCNLMDEMSASTDTKFVLITHNPITMARMDRMFGVTMAERGVSQLVSVNLEQAEKLRETA
ncbi:MAG: chromosome segregation SMC family protein [Rhizobiaceae bacterium]|nr:chromosome segregation SMC family protein [Rhizobiaceae bacterium]